MGVRERECVCVCVRERERERESLKKNPCDFAGNSYSYCSLDIVIQVVIFLTSSSLLKGNWKLEISNE